MHNLQGKVAVVLGCSASGGSGWAIAEALGAAGAKVVVAARSKEPLDKLAKLIDGKAVVCDAGDPEQVAALAVVAQATYGKIDIAVNSAGLPVRSMIADAEIDRLQQALNVNYLGNVHFIKHMAKIMNDGGSIVLISSLSAHRTSLPYFPYACAKAASDCLVRYAALEYGGRGIRVNSVVPGMIRSELAKAALAISGYVEVWDREVPLARVGVPADYADVVMWLSGPAFITGESIQVSGGNQLTRTPRNDELPAS